MIDRHRLPTAWITSLTAAVLVLPLAAAAAAQTRPTAATEGPEPPRRGFRADYLLELARLEGRTLALAREIPGERWAERTDPEIHSFDECLAGIGSASRRILTGMEREVPPAAGERPAGGEAAATAQKDGKTRRIEELAALFAAVRRAVEETPDDGLGSPIDFLGRRWTVRALFLLLLGQTHEGLGHAAAHAEALGVPPPWVKHRRVSEASVD